MAKPYFELYNECQSQISQFNFAKTLLIKLGLVFTAFSLIVCGINLMNDSQDNTLMMAAAISFAITLTCFLALLPINHKIKDLRSQTKSRTKNILVHN
ncbi:MAG: hypothetical protein JWQ14_3348 [Adhaeribacter sp.]|nr:hypothetical protein [Adhaeribacter sp.]